MKNTWFVSSLLLLATWGCPTLAVPTTAPKTKPPLPSAAQPIAPKAKIELLSLGSQPRQLLRYQPTVNTKELATLTMTMDMKMSMSGKAFPTQLPSSTMKIETTVTQVASNGDIHYTFRYVDADVAASANTPPALVRELRSQLNKLVGISGNYVIDNRGQVKSGNLKVPPNIEKSTKQLLEQLSQSFEQLSSPLPEAAIGAGAKWRVIQPFDLGGMNLKQTETFELISVQNKTATLKESVMQEARSQSLNQPNFPKGVTVTLKSLNATGEGQIILRLDRLMPTQATVSVTSMTQMETSNPQLAAPLQIDTETHVEATLKSQ